MYFQPSCYTQPQTQPSVSVACQSQGNVCFNESQTDFRSIIQCTPTKTQVCSKYTNTSASTLCCNVSPDLSQPACVSILHGRKVGSSCWSCQGEAHELPCIWTCWLVLEAPPSVSPYSPVLNGITVGWVTTATWDFLQLESVPAEFSACQMSQGLWALPLPLLAS